MIRHIRDIQARRRGEEFDPEAGFTLIELLIVIVVLGILAATVVFALSNVTGTSAVAACNSDAKSYEVAIAAYQNATTNTANAMPANTTALTANPGLYGGPFLHAAANNPAYIVAIGGDTASTVSNWPSGTLWTVAGVPTTANGTVYVGVPGKALVAYDSQTSNPATGCNAA